MSTKVTNIKALSEGWEADPQYVYIGRSVKTLINTGWGNPYYLKVESDRAYIIRQYINYIKLRLTNGDLNIMDLADKTLVCYCAPKLCHGDILALIVDTIQYSNPPMSSKVPPPLIDERFASGPL